MAAEVGWKGILPRVAAASTLVLATFNPTA
jgi:hypothetical protein